MNLKYPRQVVAIKRTNKVFEAACFLAAPGTTDNTAPLETPGFSRYVFTLVDNSQGKTVTPKANIPADEVRYIKYQTELAMQHRWTGVSAKQCDTQNTGDNILKTSLAYTQRLVDKKFKGKTPAEVLLENPENKSELVRIQEWLKANVERFPANKQQIDAIEDALTLLDIGELSPLPANEVSSAANDATIEIYNSEYKFFQSKKPGTDLNGIYNVNIVYQPAKKYPFIINIHNAYAPIETGTGGQKKIKLSAAIDQVTSSIMMTEKEWFSAISKLEYTLNCFESMTFQKQFDIMQEATKASANS